MTLRNYKVFAENTDGRRRFLARAVGTTLGNDLFELYDDDCNDDEIIVIVADGPVVYAGQR